MLGHQGGVGYAITSKLETHLNNENNTMVLYNVKHTALVSTCLIISQPKHIEVRIAKTTHSYYTVK